MNWLWACSQRNESRSESRFGSRSASWLGSWFELRAFTCIANAFPITYRICALRVNILFLGFSAHFQNVHAQITFRKSFAFTCPRIRLSTRITIQNTSFFRVSKRVSKAWFERALHSQRVKSSFQIRKGSESRSETSFGTWFIPLWTGPMFTIIPTGGKRNWLSVTRFLSRLLSSNISVHRCIPTH